MEPTYRHVMKRGVATLTDYVTLLRALTDDAAAHRVSPDEAGRVIEEATAAIGAWMDAHFARAAAMQAAPTVLRAKAALFDELRAIVTVRQSRAATADEVRSVIDRLAAFVESIDRETGTA